jgi:phospholipid/cholesterol/gamma-HCH transport system substrate-binding protein
MGERTRNVIVGMTAIVALVGIAIMLMLFGYTPRLVEQGYIIKVDMPNAGGLNEGSRVRLNGIDVGKVEHVEFQYPLNKGVLVRARIKEWASIPKGAVARTESASLLSTSPALTLDLSHMVADQYLPKDGTAEIPGEPSGLMTSMQGAVAEGLLDFKSLTEEFKRISTSFQTLSQEWTGVAKNLNEMVGPRTAAQVDNGQAQANVRTILERTDSRLRDLQKSIDGLNQWVADAQLRDDVRQAVANGKQFTARLNGTAEKVDKLVDNAGRLMDDAGKTLADTRENLDQLAKRYIGAADKLGAAIDSMRQTVDQARKGDGTAGKLLNDPALYNNLNDAATRLNQALGEFKSLMEKWKAEGLPVKF